MVLLYSTGLDSELYRLLLKPDILLFFKSGARYESFEYAQLKHFIDSGIIKQDINTTLRVDDTLNFSTIERDNSIVPMRNIFYLLRAFEYDNEIALGITLYDLHYDKQPDVLGALISFIQTYYYFRDTPDTWENVRPHIHAPYRHLTKGQLLKKVITDTSVDVEYIKTLRTCYSGSSEKGCGKCKSCVQKAIALAVNGMFSPELFDKDPRIAGKSWIKFYKKQLPDAKPSIIEVFKEEVNILIQ